MQVTIEIEPQTFSLLQKVKEKGVSLDDVLREALSKIEDEQDLPEKLSVDEQIKRLRDWANKPRNLPPPLSDEALRRENIYEDRI
ncbi:MAG: hypothetical protein M3405_02685 [Acidobacteriota bacterium]|jgi:predicted CopG family antitoxin|nr:hypothetical protein [Acidobacteriota bacterium]